MIHELTVEKKNTTIIKWNKEKKEREETTNSMLLTFHWSSLAGVHICIKVCRCEFISVLVWILWLVYEICVPWDGQNHYIVVIARVCLCLLSGKQNCFLFSFFVLVLVLNVELVRVGGLSPWKMKNIGCCSFQCYCYHMFACTAPPEFCLSFYVILLFTYY